MMYKLMNVLCLLYLPPQLDFFPALRSVIAPVFLHSLIICSKSVLEHFDVTAVHVGLGKFRF